MRFPIYKFLMLLCVGISSIYAQTSNNGNFTNENSNHVTSNTYDITGKALVKTRSYYDDLGKQIQSQSWDVKTKKVWASQTLYDEQGRAALQTFTAPIGNNFGYKSNFIIDAGGSTFNRSDLGNITVDPATVGTSSNTLGAYYSSSGAEAYQDVTDRPYSRTFYDELTPGNTLKVVGGNKVDTTGDGTPDGYPQGFTYTVPAAQELFYAFGRDRFFEIINSDSHYTPTILKTVTIDAHGVENVVFRTPEGTVLASARAGEGPKKEVVSMMGDQKFVDIHLSKGCENSVTFWDGSANYRVFDLRTGVEVINKDNLAPGIYRIVSLRQDPSVNSITIDENGVFYPRVSTAQGVTYHINYYDYTLNYYDETGRLKQSVSPIGFDEDAYARYDLTGPVSHINYDLAASYAYDSSGQLVYSHDVDRADAWFKYRADGQLRFSQNTKQEENNEFSYTNYDLKGRPVESGVYTENSTYNFNFSNPNALDGILEETLQDIAYVNDEDALKNQHCKEQHFIMYDRSDDLARSNAFGTDSRKSNYARQSFVHGNISKTFTQNPSTTTTWYSYDIYGRVVWIVQQIEGLPGVKTIDYTYDDITGAITKVYYQKGVSGEEFIHRYTYDPDDFSLITVETATSDSGPYLVHADYSYYETGELKRLELAEGIQGMDYVYNLHGALKAINHPSLQASHDPGGDSNDQFGMIIDYYSGDYKRSGVHMGSGVAGTNQYNGNIKAIRWNNRATDTDTEFEKTYAYQYNRNNWLTEATFGENINGDAEGSIITKRNETITQDVVASVAIILEEGVNITGTSSLITLEIGGSFIPDATGDYAVSGITYDANGNIQNLQRAKHTEAGSNAMDDLLYLYPQEKPNRLISVLDAVTSSTNANDIEIEHYNYNQIGQLVEILDKGEITRYIYNAKGLVNEVRYQGNPYVKFYYNDKGHRVRKESYNPNTGNLSYTDVYVRDVSGSPMAIYRDGQLIEHTIYGSNRLGVYKRSGNQTIYELTDHVGNVRALVDRDTGGDALAGTDYYPFGMAMPNRNIQGDYRYAYQGQEKDTETGKEAFELRLWDGRIGRWLTTDPAGQYASPYLGIGNNPISRIDPDGGMDEESRTEEMIVTPEGSWSDSFRSGYKWFDWNVLTPINDTFNPLAWGVNAVMGATTGYDSVGRKVNNYNIAEEILKLATFGIGAKANALYKTTHSSVNTITSKVDDLVKVRHHTGVDGLKGIKNSKNIIASRYMPYGVDVEVAPFLRPSEIQLGNVAKGSYVEFFVSKSQLSPIPGYLGGTGNAARIITNGAPLDISQCSPKFVRWNWLGF